MTGAAHALRAVTAATAAVLGTLAATAAPATAAPVLAAPAQVPASPVAPVAPASPAEWTAAPAAGRPYAYLEGPAGSVLEDTLSVTNPGPRPLTVTLTGDGPAAVAFAARSVTVPGRTRADVPFAVTVAADTPPGEHRGTVRAGAGARSVRVDLRLKVSGPELAALTVEDARVDRATGTLHYTLVNRGSTVLDRPRLAVRADGLLGTVLDRPGRPLPLSLRPGERAARTEPWPDPPALDSVTVRLTATVPGAAPATTATGAVFASAPALAGAAVPLLAAGGAAYALRRRRTKGAPA
ncbi:hypothetical protein GCM10017667_31760 [Streptomyces filamentosus]|uniref:DUF916 domain-containing protein n=1 Tax=Streptomyces filamentosus TaxID=67294 RepID=A0A919BN84_STRFL|nr:hypothetical protein GCM10017667_31760 [Streptomyces filamentosus]